MNALKSVFNFLGRFLTSTRIVVTNLITFIFLAKKIKVIKFVTTILVEVKNLPKKLKTDLSAFIAYFG